MSARLGDPVAAKRASRASFRARLLGFGLAITLPVTLGACSSFFFDDDDLEPQKLVITKPSQGASAEEFPNLGSVPEAPPVPSPQARRQALVEGLEADRENAQYSGEVLVGEQPTGAEGDPYARTAPPVATPDIRARQTASQIGNLPPPPDVPDLAPPAPAATVPNIPAPNLAEAPNLPNPPAVPAPPGAAPALGPASGEPEVFASAPPPGLLLSQQAFGQQAAAEQRMQQIALNQQVFEAQARAQAIQQQALREQTIQAQTIQRYGLRYPQLAAQPVPRAQVPIQQVPIQQAQIPRSPVPQATFVQPAVSQMAYAQPLPAQPAVPQTAYARPVQPAPAPRQAPAAAASSESGLLVGLIYFGHGSAGLDNGDRQVLRDIASIQRRHNRALRVVGHSSSRTGFVDPDKHENSNQGMSLERARSVAAALVRFGVEQGWVNVVGLSDSAPVFHEFMPTGEAGNRRVEIFLE